MIRIILLLSAVLALSACTNSRDDWGAIARGVGQVAGHP